MPLAYADTIDKYAKANNLDPALVSKIIDVESGGNPAAVSSKGAQGLMQLMPQTAKEMGVKNSLDPEQNIMGGTKYLAQLHQQFGGDSRLALAAYNAGPEKAKNPPQETREYVNKILGTGADLEKTYISNKTSSEEQDLEAWANKTAQTPEQPKAALPSGRKTVGKSSKAEGDSLGGILRQAWGETKVLGEASKAVPETAASLATGMAAWPVAKAGGLMTMPFWGGKKAQEFEDYLQGFYTYQPKGELAKGSTELAGKISAIPFKPAKWLGDIAEKITGSPDAKYGVTSVGEVATMLLIPKFTEGIKEGAKAKFYGADEEPPPAAPGEEPPTKGKFSIRDKRDSKAPGDITADMERVNQRAHDELQAAYEQVPKEEWDKFFKDEKPKNIEDVAKLVDEHAKRIGKDADVTTDLEKLPSYYQDVIKREAESVKQRAENLKDVANEAKKANADLVIVPGVMKPRESINLRPAVKYEGEVKIGKEGQEHPDVLKENKISEEAKHEQGFATPEGKWLNRFQARKWMEENQPEAFKQWQGLTKRETLHAEDYNKAVSRETPLRSAGDIARDMLTVLDLQSERGSISGEPLSPDKMAAYNRLKADFGTIAKNAKRAGKSMEDYLANLGFDQETVKYLAMKTQEGAGKQDQTAATSPDLRINLARIANTDSVKNLIAETNLAQQESGRIAETTRGVRPHEKTIAASQKVKMTVEDILNRKPGDVWNAEQQTAARDISNSLATRVKDLSDKAFSGDEKAVNDLPSALALFGEIHSQDVGVGAEIARSLESRKILSSATRRPFDPRELADLAQMVKDSGGDPKLLAARVKALEKPEELATFSRQLVNTLKTGKDMFLYCWINGLLSSGVTHMKVLASNVATFGVGLYERQAAHAIGKGLEVFGRKPGQEFNEGNAMVDGAITGFSDALDTFKKTWKEDRPEFGKGRSLEINRNPFAMENLKTSGAWGKTIEILGTIIGTPGRTLMASHQFFSALNYRAQLHVEALKEAMAEGLTGKAFEDRVNYIKQNADQFDTVNEAARAYGENQGFLSDLGKAGQKMQELTNASLFTKLIVPFMKIPLNMFKYSWERTPVLNMLSSKFWSDMKAGGARADMAMAKTSTGIMTVSALAYLAHNGLITGNGPDDPKLRKVWLETHQPYAVKIGKEWVSYVPMEPLSKIMGATAEVVSLADEHNLDSIGQYLSAAALSLSQVALQQPYLAGLSNFVEAIKSTGTTVQRAQSYIQQFAQSLVPAGARQINRTYFDRTLREVNSIADSIKSVVPGLSKSLPPKRGFWGQPIIPEGAAGPELISPFKETKAKPDAVDDEIVSNQVSMSMPSKVIGGTRPSENPMMANQPRATWGIKLNPKQYDDLVVFSRHEATDGAGNNLKESLRDLVESDYYKQQTTGPDGGRALLIKDTVREFDAKGKQMLLEKYPDLMEQMFTQQQGKIAALTPGM